MCLRFKVISFSLNQIKVVSLSLWSIPNNVWMSLLSTLSVLSSAKFESFNSVMKTNKSVYKYFEENWTNYWPLRYARKKKYFEKALRIVSFYALFFRFKMSRVTEAVTRGCTTKKLFAKNCAKFTKSTCVGVSLTKLQVFCILIKKAPTQVFSCEFRNSLSTNSWRLILVELGKPLGIL